MLSFPNTRNLLPYAITRARMSLAIFNFSEKVFNNDGSFTLNKTFEEIQSRIIELQPSDIQRLRENGVTITEGISVSIDRQLLTVPDSIEFNNKIYKVVSYTISEGASTFTGGIASGVLEV